VRAATCELLNRYIHIRVRTSRKTLLSVAVLLKAGFDVKFMTGTKKDPTFGGYLVTPDGQKIRMIFGDNLSGVCLCGVIQYVTLMMKRLLSTER
jgi:hypothetical protein